MLKAHFLARGNKIASSACILRIVPGQRTAGVPQKVPSKDSGVSLHRGIEAPPRGAPHEWSVPLGTHRCGVQRKDIHTVN